MLALCSAYQPKDLHAVLPQWVEHGDSVFLLVLDVVPGSPLVRGIVGPLGHERGTAPKVPHSLELADD